MKRNTLIRSLKECVRRLDGLDLPVTVEAFYGYGSALRKKENPGDLDLFLVYSMTEEQKLRWERFSESFKVFIKEREKMSMWKIQMKMSFPEYLSQEPISKVLGRHGIVPEWAKTFSWSNTLYYCRFDPNIWTVTTKLILKNIRRIQIFHFNDIKGFKPFDIRDKYYLLWSPEFPDIDRNFEKVSVHEIVQDKIDNFIDDFEKEKEQLMEVQPEIAEKAKKLGITFSFKKLNSLHPPIKYHKRDGPDKLQEKCELARTETKKCRIERQALYVISYVLEKKTPYRDDTNGSKEEKITFMILKEHQEKYLKEKDLREVLKVLNLPEDHVITMDLCWRGNGKCGKEYILEPEPLKRKEVKRKAKIEKKRVGYIAAIRREIQKINKNFWVYVEMKDTKPQKIEIYFREHRNNDLVPFFKDRGFTVKESLDRGFFAETHIPLQGDETKKEIIEKVMSKCH